jgi:hypothetical protein
MKQGSSETICETPFDFTAYTTVKPLHQKHIDPNFLIYFIGFFEGDGSFLINTQRCSTEITLSQHTVDLAFLHKLRAQLGFGIVYKQKTRTLAFLSIGKRENVLRMIHLLNGNLCCPARQKQFKRFVEMYNTKWNTSIQIKERTPTISLQNGWLAGFVDAEGSFSVTFRERAKASGKTPVINATFSLTQKNPTVLYAVRDALVGKSSKYIRFDASWNGYSFQVGQVSFRTVLLRYFSVFPLRTRKAIVLQHWRVVHTFLVKKKHLDGEGFETVSHLWKKMQRMIERLKRESDL